MMFKLSLLKSGNNLAMGLRSISRPIFATAAGVVLSFHGTAAQPAREEAWIGPAVVCLAPVDGNHRKIGPMYKFFDINNNGLEFVGGYRGLFSYDGKVLHKIKVANGGSTRRVYEMEGIEDNLFLVGAEKGLFLFDGKALSMIDVVGGNVATDVSQIINVDDRGLVFVGAGEGLFHYNGKVLRKVRVAGNGKTGSINILIKNDTGDRIYAAAEEGLFRYEGDTFRKIEVAGGGETGEIFDVFQAEDGDLEFVGAMAGVFRHDGSRLHRIPIAGGGTASFELVKTNSGKLKYIRSSHEVLLLDGKLLRTLVAGDTGWILVVSANGDDLQYVGGEKGLFQYKNGALHKIEVAGGGTTGGVISLFETERGGLKFVGGENGLFRYDGDALHKVEVAGGGSTGWVLDSNGLDLFAGRTGLFAANRDSIRIPMEQTSYRSPESAFSNGEPATIVLTIEHPCSHAVEMQIRLVKNVENPGNNPDDVVVDWIDTSPISVVRNVESLQRHFNSKHAAQINLDELKVRLERGDTYLLQTRVTYDNGTVLGQPVTIGNPIRIGESPLIEFAKRLWANSWGSAAIVLVAALTAGRFVGFLVLRLFPLQFLRLSSSIAEATNINLGLFEVSPAWLFGASGRHSEHVLSAWVQRNLDAVKQAYGRNTAVIPTEQFVPLPVVIERFGNESDPPNDLMTCLRRSFAELRPRLLIIGEGGSGKTALATWIGHGTMESNDGDRLGVRYRLPVVIDNDLAEAEGIIERVEQILTIDYQVSWLDRALVAVLLNRGHILLILDRLSELQDTTREKLQSGHPDFPNAAFVATTRVLPNRNGTISRILQPALLSGKSLSQFVFDFQPTDDKSAWSNTEKHKVVGQIESAFGEKPVTVLFVKLAIEKLRDSGIGKPINRGDLVRDYVRRLDATVNSRPMSCTWPVPLNDAQALAWEILDDGFRLRELPRNEAENLLGGAVRLTFLVEALRLYQWARAETAVSSMSDPIVEHLGALHLLEKYSSDEEEFWNQLFENIRSELDRLKARDDNASVDGFILALRSLAFEIDPDHPICILLTDKPRAA